MLKIHKLHSKKLFIVIITSILNIGAFLGLAYHPNLAHAETVTSKKTIADITYMQEITPTICNNSESGKQYPLKDSRDQKTYLIAKLRDGNCWMTQNLNIVNKIISSVDSDMQSGNFTIPASNKSGFTVDDITTSKAYSDATYGGYYNWYTATAGSGNESIVSGSAPNSICPKGWWLPSMSGNKSYSNLFLSYGKYINGTLQYSNQSIIDYPLNFTKGGFISGGSQIVVGTDGYYWSSAAYDATKTQRLNFSNTVGSFTDGTTRNYGFSVRCATSGNKEGLENNVEITINNTISLEVDNEIEVEKTETNPSTANFDVKVASNQGYKVQINSTNPTLTSSTTSTTIPSRAGALNTAINGWGIKLSTSSTYTQITSGLKTFYTASGAEVKTVPFTIGISTSPDLPNGEYSTGITITATQN